MNIRRPIHSAARILLATGIGIAALTGLAQPAQAGPCSPNPTITRSVSTSIFYEHEFSTVTVKLSATPCSKVKVTFKTADGSAKAGQDYIAVSKVFTFQANTAQLSQSVDVHGFEDGEQEGIKKFSISLSNATGGATIGTPTGNLKVNGVEPQ